MQLQYIIKIGERLMIVQVKCPTCKTTILNQKQIEQYADRSFLQGFQCPRCDDEASLFVEGKKNQDGRGFKEILGRR